MLKFVFRKQKERFRKWVENQTNRIGTEKGEESKMKKMMLTMLLAFMVFGSGCTTSQSSTSTRPTNSEEQQLVENKAKDEERQEITKEWEAAREQLRKQLQTEQSYPQTKEEREQAETRLAKSKQQDRKRQMPQFAYLRQWKPNDMQNGYGADILIIEDELSEQMLVSFVRLFAGSHDPVVIRIFTSVIAYDQEQNDRYGPEYDSDYILCYIKNFSGRGACRGCNEIRWMQETGKFSSKFGTAAKF